MRKTAMIAGLLILLLLAGCGAKNKSNKKDDFVDYQTEETLDNSELTTEETLLDEISQEQAMDIAYRYAISDIQNAGEKEIAISFEEDTELTGDVCYTFRVSEETDEKSLTLGFYAIGYFSRIVYRMDPVSGEYVQIGEVDSSGILIDMAADAAYEMEPSLDELLATVRQSKNITFELLYEPGTQTAVPTEDMDSMMSCFTAESMQPIDYPFLFSPEYMIFCDKGAQLLIMRDSSGSDFNLDILQFVGSDIFYSVNPNIYDTLIRLRSPEMADSMSHMHVFASGTDAKEAIDAAVKGYGVYISALEYFQKSGYALASMMEEDIYRLDSYDIMDASQDNPNLVPVIIAYSVKTVSEEGEERWVNDNMFVGAIWLEQRGTQTRAYVLGLEPYQGETADSWAEMTQAIYVNSAASR